MRLAAWILLAGLPALAQTPEAGVRAVLEEQARAWNAGDLEAFVRTYSAETVFVGKEITRGSAGVLERYRRNYPARERMGTLDFPELEVRMLDREHASVIGRFRLQRSAAGGGDAQGVFTLLLKKTEKGWKILVDHTS